MSIDLGDRLLRSTARQFGKAFEKRRGFLVKLAQFLAFENEAFESELARFFYRLPPLSASRVQFVLQDELGRDPFQLLAHVDPIPIAAASIGQVHRAVRRDGRSVAIKVQYPLLAEAVAADTELLERIARFLPYRGMTAELVDEVKARLKEEVDFRAEAAQTVYFREHLGLHRVRIPAVHSDLSTSRVLTLELMDGAHLDQWLVNDPGAEARNDAGTRLAELFWRSFFHLGRVHADLHPGNLLFSPEGDLTVLDFGAVQPIQPKFSQMIAGLIRAALAGDQALGFELSQQGGMLGELDTHQAQGVYERAVMPFLDWFVGPLRVPVFDFASARGQARLGRSRFLAIVRDNPQPGVYRPLLFLNRTVYLLYSVLERLECSVALAQVFESNAVQEQTDLSRRSFRSNSVFSTNPVLEKGSPMGSNRSLGR